MANLVEKAGIDRSGRVGTIREADMTANGRE
jgi:hypothetical protein